MLGSDLSLELELLKPVKKPKKFYSCLLGLHSGENITYTQENEVFLVLAETVKPLCMFYGHPVYEVRKVTVLSTRNLKVKSKLSADFTTVIFILLAHILIF